MGGGSYGPPLCYFRGCTPCEDMAVGASPITLELAVVALGAVRATHARAREARTAEISGRARHIRTAYQLGLRALQKARPRGEPGLWPRSSRRQRQLLLAGDIGAGARYEP